jgi:hypothetical protein
MVICYIISQSCGALLQRNVRRDDRFGVGHKGWLKEAGDARPMEHQILIRRIKIWRASLGPIATNP